MQERFTGNEPFLQPEHWGGHSTEDACNWLKWPELKPGEDVPFFKGLTELSRISTDAMLDFFQVTDVSPVRTFNEGEIFDGTEYPEGTIVKLARERLRTTSDSTAIDPYDNGDHWGVIVGYEHKGERKRTLMTFWDFPQGHTPRRFIGTGRPSPIAFRVGEATHDRIKRGRYRYESFKKVTKVELYKFGQPVREPLKEPSRRLNPFDIFNPHPEPAGQ